LPSTQKKLRRICYHEHILLFILIMPEVNGSIASTPLGLFHIDQALVTAASKE
jgi:hypothetical protein